MTRLWPTPTGTKTIHFIGDVQGATQSRLNIVTADVTRNCPDVAARVTVGDFVNSWGAGHPTEGTSFVAAQAFMDGLGPEDWYTCMGNHDAHGTGYTPDFAATQAGMPSSNFVVDLGFVVLIFAWVRCAGHAQEPSASTATNLVWLEARLVEYSNRPVFVIGHGTLDVTGYLAQERTQMLALFNTYTCVKAYLCGHSHQTIDHASIAQMYNTGTRTIAQVNGSALLHTFPDVDWTDRLCSTYLTVGATECEVRFRDHGARQWVGGGGQRVRRWTFPMN